MRFSFEIDSASFAFSAAPATRSNRINEMSSSDVRELGSSMVKHLD